MWGTLILVDRISVHWIPIDISENWERSLGKRPMAKILADIRLCVKQIFSLLFFVCVFESVVVTFLD